MSLDHRESEGDDSQELTPLDLTSWKSHDAAAELTGGVEMVKYVETRDLGICIHTESERHRDAMLAFRLVAVSPVGHQERLNAQALLLGRLRMAPTSFPGVSRALELRYIVQPMQPGGTVRQEITCYLLARYSDWRLGEHDLVQTTRGFGGEIAQLLETMPNYQFYPILDAAEVEEILTPFVIMDTAEFRQDEIIAGPLPGVFGGVPDADVLVAMMARQRAATILSICLEPTDAESALNALHDAPPIVEAYPSAEFQGNGDERVASALASSEATIARERFQMVRMAAFRRQVFRLRLQVASSAALGDALLGTFTAEIGGPSRILAQAAWQNPSSPIAGSAIAVRPRAGHTINEEASESAIALANLAGLTFVPWGEHSRSLAPYLVDLSEATRLFALPATADWLDAQSVALPLPFREHLTDGLRLGINQQQQNAVPVMLPTASRSLHSWIVGQTGTGKSTLLESLILQDIHAGRGVIVIDPHGELNSQVLAKIPASRAEDVILFDPADTDFPIGINMLEAEGEDEQALVVSSFIGLLRKLFDPHTVGIVGPRFEHAVRNGLLTVMSAPDGGTLVELMRVLTDDAFMRSLLPHIKDPMVLRYWKDQIAHTSEFHRSEVLDYIVSKFGPFVTDFTLRRIVGQIRSGFHFRQAMDERKIVLLSLAKGKLGSTNANFLGLILLPMILQAALSRSNIDPSERHDCTLYIDEFQNYATDSLALMLAEARKYHVALVLANQHVGQLTGEIRDAVLGNVGSIISFRLGAADAMAMEQILAPSPVDAHHLINLPNYTAYCRLLINGKRSAAFTLNTELSPYPADPELAQRIRDLSRAKYAMPRVDVDRWIAERSQLTAPPPQQRVLTPLQVREELLRAMVSHATPTPTTPSVTPPIVPAAPADTAHTPASLIADEDESDEDDEHDEEFESEDADDESEDAEEDADDEDQGKKLGTIFELLRVDLDDSAD